MTRAISGRPSRNRASASGVPGRRDEREHQAQQRGQVFAEDHHQFGLAALAEPLPQAAVAACLVDLLQAGAHRHCWSL